MPLNDERPNSTSSGEDQGSDVESSSERCDSMTLNSDLECSRDSFTSDSSSKHCSPSSSPPKTLTLDEVMESARDLFNLSLSHEIVMNRNFHLEPNSLPQDSLDEQILLSFLNPGANRMRTQIMEVLDMDLIRQQADNDALDIQGLASYIITTMGKMCAPVRDEEIKKLREGTDNIVTLFKEIFRVLSLMRADMVNCTIENLRPVLQRQSVEYERAKFQSILDKTPSALDRTTSWIKSALEELQSSIAPTEQTNGPGKGQPVVPGPFQVLNAAFIRILTWDYSKSPPPETWMTDEIRLQEIQWQLQQCQAVNEVLLIVYSTIGGPIQGLPSLSDRLKRMISVLLDGMHRSDFNLEESLEGISAQICCELNKSLTERSYPALTPALQGTLTGQICNITHKDNPIRTLVEDRVQQYFMALISDPKPQSKIEQVPAGLTAIKPELAIIGAKFISLVNYNKTVYGPFYADILRKLMFSNSQPAANPPQNTAQDSVTHN
ncbi:T-complex protein 11-like protein 2 [Pundamilia nyererei]|uniref:T-complex protein 11-like protein 2 n=1 Tax=Pundamilia nyererei TaxID=303518 RepID=A0A9Y3VDV9_9CICH|nr:PREDICTED: T-complex protein 11-like protein 2 [Pundamilia nyererei]